MLWTLANALACSRYHNLLHVSATLLKSPTAPTLLTVSAPHHPDRQPSPLQNAHLLRQQLYATLAATAITYRVGRSANTGLDLSATLSAKGDEVVLFAVNDTPRHHPLAHFSAFGTSGQRIAVWTLTTANMLGTRCAEQFRRAGTVASVRATFHARAPKFDYAFRAVPHRVRWKSNETR